MSTYPTASMRRWCFVVPALLSTLWACGDSGTSPEPPSPSPVAFDLGVLAVAIATGSQGASFFDNFWPCINRGLADYSNTPTGRRTSVYNCDTGGGVVIDGAGSLDWTTSGASETERQRLDRIIWTGNLTAVAGSASRSVSMFVVEPFYSQESPNERLDVHNLDSLRVTVEGAETMVRDTAAFQSFGSFASRSIGSIPNLGASVDALLTADVRRLVFDAGLEWLLALINEFEQSSPHTHEECGVVAVTYDGLEGLPRLTSTLPACPLRRGLFIAGDFVSEFTAPIPPGNNVPSEIAWSLTGDFEVGGGVPRVALSKLEMVASIPPSITGILRVTGKVVGLDGTEIPFDFSVLVDD